MHSKLFFFFLLFLCVSGASAQTIDSAFNELNTNGVWQKTDLFITTYDNQCRSTSSLYKNWNAASQGWVNNNLSNYTYDAAGRQLEYLSQTWDNTQGKWINSSLTKYDYSDDGAGYIVTFMNWDNINNSWQNISRGIVLLNTAGLRYYSLAEVYINNGWQPNSRDSSIYDTHNRMTLYKTENYENNTWVNVFQAKNRYKGNGLLNGSLSCDWDAGTKSWIKVFRQEYNLLPESMLFKNTITQYHDLILDKWINSGLTNNTYNSDLHLISSVSAYWDNNTGQWIKNLRLRYDYYQDGSAYHLYVDVKDNITNKWNTVFRITFTHHGCILNARIAKAGTSSKVSPTGRMLSGKQVFNNNGVNTERSGNTWTYDIQLKDNNNLQQNLSNYQVTVEAGPAQAPAMISKTPTLPKVAITGVKTFTVFPNPAQDYLIVTPAKQLQPGDAILKLYDLSCKLILSKKILSTGAQKLYLPNVARGIYMITITSKAGSQTLPLMIK